MKNLDLAKCPHCGYQGTLSNLPFTVTIRPPVLMARSVISGSGEAVREYADMVGCPDCLKLFIVRHPEKST